MSELEDLIRMDDAHTAELRRAGGFDSLGRSRRRRVRYVVTAMVGGVAATVGFFFMTAPPVEHAPVPNLASAGTPPGLTEIVEGLPSPSADPAEYVAQMATTDEGLCGSEAPKAKCDWVRPVMAELRRRVSAHDACWFAQTCGPTPGDLAAALQTLLRTTGLSSTGSGQNMDGRRGARDKFANDQDVLLLNTLITIASDEDAALVRMGPTVATAILEVLDAYLGDDPSAVLPADIVAVRRQLFRDVLRAQDESPSSGIHEVILNAVRALRGEN